ncbi:hypothetical protein CERSUDRAFT_112444 [Gelatoporia subvermispora B]|uniref:Peptidase S54 rhomboid domain-containing protein n=1 Tax=Ceriporiopsis subvermispora (strain B) TaxID=914234 RepID=M2R736_CERS8|nr:hypothetical protein CERSUDRAFT_112444 [Gelatoporia subvermispora B]
MLFAVFVSLGVFGFAASQTIDETIDEQESIKMLGGVWAIKPTTSYELMSHRKRTFDQSLLAIMNQLHEVAESLPRYTAHQLLIAYYQLAQPLVETSEGRRTCWTIGAASAAMLLLWKIPPIRPFLSRHFAHDPLSGKSYTMLTSLLSYKSFLHFALTSMTLTSFGAMTAFHFQEQLIRYPHDFPVEATIKWKLLAFLISAGLFSTAYAHFAALRHQYPRLLSRLTSSAVLERNASALMKAGVKPVKTAGPTSLKPLMGMSGAACAALTYSILAFPDVNFDVFGLFQINPMWIFHAVMAPTLVGVTFAMWTSYWPLYVNHFVHLGGACFGAIWLEYGDTAWIYARIATLMIKIQWHKFWEAFQ